MRNSWRGLCSPFPPGAGAALVEVSISIVHLNEHVCVTSRRTVKARGGRPAEESWSACVLQGQVSAMLPVAPATESLLSSEAQRPDSEMNTVAFIDQDKRRLLKGTLT